MEVKIETQFGMNTFQISRINFAKIMQYLFAFAEKKEEKEVIVPIGDSLKYIPGGVVLSPDAEKQIDTINGEEKEEEESMNHTRNDSLFGEGWKNTVKNQNSGQEEGYRGFLHVKCQVCGKVKDYCVKETITEANCTCGEKIPLKNLKPMYVKCNCGKDFRYYTNMTDERFTCKCISCRSRVKIRMNTRGTAYVTDCRNPAKTPFSYKTGMRNYQKENGEKA